MDKNSPVAARIGALLERILFLKPFTWNQYYRYKNLMPAIEQAFLKNAPFKTHHSLNGSIKFLKKHYPQFIKDL